jgi:hypothetical protein
MTGGTISGNTATAGSGGGVYIDSAAGGAIFTKTGVTIYGKDGGTEKNTASTDNNGPAVYSGLAPTIRKRISTAGTTINLDNTIPANWE